MSAASKTCGACGHSNSVDAMFCSKCGARLPSREELAAAAAAASAAAEAPPSPSSAVSATTPDAGGPATGLQAPRRRTGAAKTMLGWQPEPPPDAPAPQAGAEVAEAPKPAGPARRIAGSSRTMLGMPAPDAQAIAAAVEHAKSARANPPAVEDSPQAVAATAPGGAGRLAVGPDEPAPEPPPKRRASVGPTNRTMLGQAAPKVEPAAVPGTFEPPTRRSDPPAPRGRARAVYPSPGEEDEPLALPKKKRGGLAVAMIAIGLAALLGGGAALAVTLTSGSDLRASVVQGADGEMLEIEVPGASPGTRVRFRGAEQSLEAGRARFPLSADDLALGDNELTVDVLAPDGAIESQTIDLHLEMRVRADLGPLERVPPAIDVIVEVPPGSEVTLDGEPVEIDAQGRATRRVPIDGAEANAEGVVEHVVRYRVVPPEGEPAQGALRTRIPLTTMQVDRPGREVVTEAAEVEVAGAVAPGSIVTVAGSVVEVSLGRFLTRHPLPSVGEHTIEVVARAPGKAPRIERIRVRRVADLEAEAARFEVDRELTYARIAQDPTTYRGQHVELEGIVYNVDVSSGRSVLQVLVSDCPDGARCPLWVTYPAATDAELQDRVRVLGTVAGEQQFRSQRGEIRTVPRVDATFVLPAEASGRRR